MSARFHLSSDFKIFLPDFGNQFAIHRSGKSASKVKVNLAYRGFCELAWKMPALSRSCRRKSPGTIRKPLKQHGNRLQHCDMETE